MINSWREDIRRSGQLRITEKAGMKRDPWKSLLRRAIAEFNKLSEQHDLGVIFISGDDTANVTVDTKPGTGLVGNAPFQSLVPGGRPDSEGRVFRCDIALPADPKVHTPKGTRQVGGGVLLVMLVHELVHACGLSNEEHSRTGDLFIGSPNLLIGDTRTGDLVDSGRADDSKNRIGMPPLLLNDGTVSKIQRSWRGPTASLRNFVAPPGARHVAAAQVGPAGLVAGSVARVDSRRLGPLSINSADGSVRQVWS